MRGAAGVFIFLVASSATRALGADLTIATTPEAPEPPAWREARDDWGFEVRVGPSVGVQGSWIEGERSVPDAGGVMSVGFRRRLRNLDTFDAVFIGTELGIDVRVEARPTIRGGGVRTMIGLEPVSRVSGRYSRYRYPTVAQYLAPGVGVAIDTPPAGSPDPGRASFYLGLHVFPWAVLFTEHVGLEVSTMVPFNFDVTTGAMTVSPSITTSVLFR
mgnify:CR=1 FL=1